jgi:hypothetical protein
VLSRWYRSKKSAGRGAEGPVPASFNSLMDVRRAFAAFFSFPVHW